eukprot:TRINITY_DN8697_c0_g1_i1.p1 TRINITY_DN8697_c0_g1~~TRINITY_DN8697_c0_g1_i1.p1  ORF type:complete len:303 (-),score=38.69 TRINITY_DN8697_c0_g1_i1:28-864(-)
MFEPLFEATLRPSKHPQLAQLLNHISSFATEKVSTYVNSVNTFAKESDIFYSPSNWDLKNSPPFSYYLYYFWANIKALNALRKSKGLSTICFRPSILSKDVDHSVAAFVLADSVTEALSLEDNLVAQYLYYLAQIGVVSRPLYAKSMSSVSYGDHPFCTFFRRGLKVSLGTGRPLQLHISNDPLAEEYALAAQMWKFTTTDLCELARSSILISGFPSGTKKKLIGVNYEQPGPEGNDPHKTNVPNIRLAFRQITLEGELKSIKEYAEKFQESDSVTEN